MNVNIKVIGVGGGGSNAMNRMIEAGVVGVDFICMSTDQRLQIGEALTRGLGAGGNPEVGRNAAEESRQNIKKLLDGSDMVFIIAGMGGGTGSGAAPVIAEIGRDIGALTVGIVTKPFAFEGPHRMRIAAKGIGSLGQRVDTMIAIPNDRLLPVVEQRTTLNEALRLADDILRQGVQGISDIITLPGLINVDFADVKAILTNAGTAIMGIGTGSGDQRAVEAAEMATSSPLLEASIRGARGVLLNVTAGANLTLAEVYEAWTVVSDAASPEGTAPLIGAIIDERMEEEARVTVLAVPFGSDDAHPAFVLKQPNVPRLRPGSSLDFPTPPMGQG